MLLYKRLPLESNGAALALALVVASAWSLAAWSLAGAAAPQRLGAVDVVGTAFRIELSGGRVIGAEELVGSTLSLVPPGETEPRQVRIDQVVVDPLDRERETLLYRMRLVDVETGERRPWKEVIPPDVSSVLYGNLYLSRDGASYLYRVRRIDSHLFVIEGLR